MRQITEFNSLKARLTQENCELHRHVQDLDQVNAALTKAKTSLQQELEEAKSALEEETAVSGYGLIHFQSILKEENSFYHWGTSNKLTAVCSNNRAPNC